MVLVNERSLELLDCVNYADWDDARQPMSSIFEWPNNKVSCNIVACRVLLLLHSPKLRFLHGFINDTSEFIYASLEPWINGNTQTYTSSTSNPTHH